MHVLVPPRAGQMRHGAAVAVRLGELRRGQGAVVHLTFLDDVSVTFGDRFPMGFLMFLLWLFLVVFFQDMNFGSWQLLVDGSRVLFFCVVLFKIFPFYKLLFLLDLLVGLRVVSSCGGKALGFLFLAVRWTQNEYVFFGECVVILHNTWFSHGSVVW